MKFKEFLCGPKVVLTILSLTTAIFMASAVRDFVNHEVSRGLFNLFCAIFFALWSYGVYYCAFGKGAQKDAEQKKKHDEETTRFYESLKLKD